MNSDQQLAMLAANALSGADRVANVQRLSALLRTNWKAWERVWVAAGLGDRAPLVCNLNLPGMTAKADHHPIAARLRTWAQTASAVETR